MNASLAHHFDRCGCRETHAPTVVHVHERCVRAHSGSDSGDNTHDTPHETNTRAVTPRVTRSEQWLRCKVSSVSQVSAAGAPGGRTRKEGRRQGGSGDASSRIRLVAFVALETQTREVLEDEVVVAPATSQPTVSSTSSFILGVIIVLGV